VILLVDNYDSFTWNLFQVMGGLGADVEVLRNDAVTVAQIRGMDVRGIVLSPGPGTPDESGVCLDVLRELQGELPILGVCLGHQAICQVAGGHIGRAAAPVHGKPWDVLHDGRGIFEGLPQPLRAGRYHSLVATDVPDTLRVAARTPEGEVMAVQDRARPTWGVQFHPESVLTPDGDRLLANWLTEVARWTR
jgi:anthranilate synthase/aminodeoxychorismate synthase-like glutamine amidotransferase